MRTTDRAPGTELSPAIPIPPLPAGSGALLPAPEPAPIPLGDRVKAAGLIVLTGTLGVGAVLLGRSLLQPDTEEFFPPPPSDSGESVAPSKPIRQRLAVITPKAGSIAPPESFPLAQAQPGQRSSQPARSRLLPSLGVSRGFGNASQPAAVAVAPVPASGAAPTATPSGATPAIALPPSAGSPALQRQAPPPTLTALLQAPVPRGLEPPASVATASPPVHTPRTTNPPRETAAQRPTPRPPVSALPAPASSPPEPSSSSTSPRPVPIVPTPETVTVAPERTVPGDRQPSSPPASGAAPAPTLSIADPTAPPPLPTQGIPVERLRITGNTRFSERELAMVAQQALTPEGSKPAAGSDPTVVNRALSAAELVRASEAITRFYTGRGYISSGAYVPAEVMNGAPPEIRVVEGKLEKINVQVESPGFLWLGRPLSRRYVERRLASAVRVPLQIDQLVDAVKLLEQDPLIARIATELAPGTATGSNILNVKVRQAAPMRASLSVDNGRSPSVGRLRQQLSLVQANILGLGDFLQAGFNRSEGSRGWNLGYTIPINSRNGTLSFNYNRNRGEVIEEPFRELDIKSRSQTYEVALRQPLKQTSTEEFALTLRGTHYRSNGVFLEGFNGGVALPFPSEGSDADGNTRVTALRFGQEWLKRGERNVVALQSEFSLGVNALGATVLDRAPDGRFFAWQGRASWVHAFAPDTLLALRGQLQLSDRRLVPVEQLSLGGIDTVRGYRASTLLSDNGLLASLEAYLPILRIPKWQGVLQVVPFFDIGRGWNRGDAQPTPNLLMSAGLGLQWKLGDNFRARVDWGIPLVNSQTDTGRSLREGLHFSVILSP